MKSPSLLLLALAFATGLHAQKKIYIPEDLRGMDLKADTSKWAFSRSIETDDLIFMWERGFGSDPANPPMLDGKSMAFDLNTLRDRVQTFYTFFRDTLGWIATPSAGEGGGVAARTSKADRYKMMVMVMYSLDGTAYGGTYDNFIGGLWVAPNRIQDTTMNCMAHELGHSFQAQIMADSIGEAWGGSGFFEMTSQWMLWQVNPWWLRDENFHFEAFKTLTHKAYLHPENIYHSPFVIQWWSDLHGRKSIAELYRQGKIGEDPVATYKRMYGMSQSAFCDEMLLGYQHLVNFDFNHARRETRPYACTFDTPLEQDAQGWLRPKDAPEAYGFNAIKLDGRLDLNAPGFSVEVKGKNVIYGFVGITTDGKSIYSPKNATTFLRPADSKLAHLYLVVMGAPDSHGTEGTFPYSFRVKASTAAQAGTQWNTPGAGNPFIPGYFADPTIRKFGDTYYLYATTDGTGNGYGPAQVWVSKDFVNWKNIVMNWPTTEVVWAPDVVQQPDGRYRYYYCEPCVVSIGESDSPLGPWHNILGREDAVMVPDRFVHNVITLDPQLFRDDDGSEYLYFTTWGIYKGFGCGVAKLNGQWTMENGQLGAEGGARFWREDAPFPIAADTFFTEKRLIPNTELKDIFEAPFVFKRGGTYYFTYSSGSCHDHTYRVQYATSKAGPMGPFEYKGCILETNADQTVHGPGHHSILHQDGKYYIVYHRHNLPRSVHGFNRQICIDEMKFDADGNIVPIVPTHDGIMENGQWKMDNGKGKMDNGKGRMDNGNLAFRAKTTASSYYDEWFKPEYAVDDNNATLWKASRCNWDSQQPCTRHDEWLQIDLGKPMTFNEVWTQFEYATFFYQYRIETSLDGNKWTTYADRTDNTMQGSPMIDSGKAKARYLRITITDTQKNGHMPAIWNVKVWQRAPELPQTNVATNDGYPGMHKKDVESAERDAKTAVISLKVETLGLKNGAKPFDVTEVDCGADGLPGMKFKANKPIRARVKDGRWALFFNGTQQLVSEQPIPQCYRYNAPFTIAAWVLSTKVGPVSTVASLSTSRADLANTEFRLGTDPATGLISHNGSFESCGAPDAIKAAEGKWQFWTVTYDGWLEKVYLNGKLLRQQNNFLMVRPEGHVTIGADASGSNNFMGYISSLGIYPQALSAEVVEFMYKTLGTENHPSLGDDDFEEIDPDSRFTLPAAMKPIYEQKDAFRLSATTAAFNDDPLHNGGTVYKEVEGDFVVMATISDMEGLQARSVKGFNEGGLLIADGQGTTYQLGAFPLYNCGNMLTVLSPQGRPQFPNQKGYDFDPILQFERRGNQLFARTSRDGRTWSNMPGSPIEVTAPSLSIGAYQTTYTDTPSWISLSNYVIYQ